MFREKEKGRVLARPYLMLYIIFPIHLNVPTRSGHVFNAIIHREKTVHCYLRKFFLFQKDAFYDIVHACDI